MQEIFDVTAIATDDSILISAKKTGDLVIQSVLIPGEINNVTDLASWLLAQTGQQQSTDVSLQKRLTVDYHINQVANPDGDPEDQVIIDSVQADPLPADDGRSNFQSLPGWASWSGSEAESWIETNVTDLASAKIALKAMAKAIVYLRNVVVD